MNKGRLVFGIGLIVLAAAIFAVSSSANLKIFGMDNYSGSANKVTTNLLVPDIRSIKADGVVDVHISMGDTESVRYVFDDTRFKNKSIFEDGVLQISFPTKGKGFTLFGSSGSGVDVYVTVDSIEYIEMNGVGSVRTDDVLKANEIKVVNEGTGSMKIEVAANKIIGRNSGVGSLKFSGKVESATLSNQGVGSLNADKLIAQVMDARNEGVGSMKVYAEKEIELRNSGVGSLRYSGDARVISSNSEGIGSISKR